MRRALAGALAVVIALAVAPAAHAHPLGNFSVNHLTRISVDRDEVRLHWILDQAEIPTFQERGLPARTVLARKESEALRGLHVDVGGRDRPLRLLPGARLTHPPGQGGLPLTRVELDLVAPGPTTGTVRLRDETFPDRVGWKAVVARPGHGTTVRSSAPSGDPTQGLRVYPKDSLSSPLDERSARLAVTTGTGTLIAPPAPGAAAATTRNRAGDGLAGVFSRAAAGHGVLLLLLLAAFGWGAVHALSPGHGKAMVAAYLVGAKGTARHAVALGATVTITHTAGVFALGLVTLLLSAYILPEQLYPWLNLVSGLLVVGIGAAALRSRIRRRRHDRAHAHAHAHGHDHDHDHDDHHHSHAAGHPHRHDVPDTLSWRTLIALGASAGMIPCPSALVVLLAAVAQHQLVLGLLMITVFSLGLAATLTGLGLIVVWAGTITRRVSFTSPLAAALPSLSALVIVAVGGVLTLRALGQLG
jgi:nickel/cobalt transporter (NicO) family protein